LLNEHDHIGPLYEQITRTLKDKYRYEIIFIDDGSTDMTSHVIESLGDKKVKLISFKRNFGKSDALSAGFKKASGSFIITMDGDLQDNPEEIPNFISKINQGYDMVVGWKYKRRDPITKRVPSKFFNRLTSWITGLKIHDSNCCFKIMKNEVVKDIGVYGELHRYIPALAHWKGYKVTEMPVKHMPRKFGKSKYGIGRLVKGMLDLVTISFLNTYGQRPMHIFGGIGVATFIVGFIISLHLALMKIMYNAPIRDRPLLLLGVLLLVVGIQFISIGLLGEMIVQGRKASE
jgi:glycosyltransferase involved in cell wall biosynthesis